VEDLDIAGSFAAAAPSADDGAEDSALDEGDARDSDGTSEADDGPDADDGADADEPEPEPDPDPGVVEPGAMPDLDDDTRDAGSTCIACM
jgi:hypothetical protein